MMEHIDVRRFRALRDSLQNMCEAFGETLLPAVQAMTYALNNLVLPLVSAGWQPELTISRLGAEVERLQWKAQEETGCPITSARIWRAEGNMFAVFVPVASQAHIVLDDDGVPIDHIEEGEPYRSTEGIVDYTIDQRWLTVFTPTRRFTGERAAAILAQYEQVVVMDPEACRAFWATVTAQGV